MSFTSRMWRADAMLWVFSGWKVPGEYIGISDLQLLAILNENEWIFNDFELILLTYACHESASFPPVERHLPFANRPSICPAFQCRSQSSESWKPWRPDQKIESNPGVRPQSVDGLAWVHRSERPSPSWSPSEELQCLSSDDILGRCSESWRKSHDTAIMKHFVKQKEYEWRELCKSLRVPTIKILGASSQEFWSASSIPSEFWKNWTSSQFCSNLSSSSSRGSSTAGLRSWNSRIMKISSDINKIVAVTYSVQGTI